MENYLVFLRSVLTSLPEILGGGTLKNLPSGFQFVPRVEELCIFKRFFFLTFLWIGVSCKRVWYLNWYQSSQSLPPSSVIYQAFSEGYFEGYCTKYS